MLVSFGGALGSLLRYWVTLLVGELVGEVFPLATLAINVSGSFVIGCFVALTDGKGLFAGNMSLRLLVVVGICGGFTTFSAFSLQTLLMLRGGEWMWAVVYITASVLFSVLATAFGIWLFTRA